MIVWCSHRTRRLDKSRKFFIVIVGLCVSVYILHLFARLSTELMQGRKQKVVSFTLYANEGNMQYILGRYMPGIKENLRKVREFYPGWSMRIYTNISQTDPRFFQDVRFEKDLSILDINTLLPKLSGDMRAGMENGQVWRFLPIYDPTVHIFISRDLDSAVNSRERAAVKQWEESDKVFHAMHDNPVHCEYVLAGMWGAKNYLFDVNITITLEYMFSKVMNSRTSDQHSLGVGLYIPLKSLFMVHASYCCESLKPTIPFPTKREDPTQFVGQVLTIPHNKTNVTVCPEACRPDYGKDWIYC